MGDYITVERSPTPEEYQKLRESVGWGKLAPRAMGIGVDHSLYSVCVIHEGEMIGCGRVIGDGGIYFYIQDVIVSPAFQGKGVGKCIMDAIMGYLSNHAHPGAFVGLMAAKGSSKFYEKYGFTERPPDRPGMFWMRARDEAC